MQPVVEPTPRQPSVAPPQQATKKQDEQPKVETSAMHCPICDANDKWKNIDEFRMLPKGMSICDGCGMVSYPNLYRSEEEIKAYYRTDYRQIPKYKNLITGSRKNHNHDLFLGDELRALAARKPDATVGEVGAAYGIFLNHIRTNYLPKGKFYGTELTTTYRRVAFHEYGLELTEDLDLTKKYDLIISYKVAEHQMDVNKRLREYVESLADGGLFYISVPIWFEAMTNFGLPGFDLEYYYDTNHINVWTRTLFETLLKKVGLEVIKYDNQIYDHTYLCKRNDKLMTEAPQYEKVEDILKKMAAIKKAFQAMQAGDTRTAIYTYPNYPEAWANHYERKRAELHEHKQDVSIEEVMSEFVEPMRRACGDCYDVWRLAADVCMRYDQYEQSLEFWQKCANVRPGSASVLSPVSHCFRRLAEMPRQDPRSVDALRRKAIEVTRHWIASDLESRPEAISWLYYDLSKLPLPSEVPGADIKE